MPGKPEHSLAVHKKRIRYLAWHRGMKEADLILGVFVDQHLEEMDQAACQWFETLFNEADQDILDWITGKAPTPKAFDTATMDRIKTLDHMKK